MQCRYQMDPWLLGPDLALRLARAMAVWELETRIPVAIISGHRTRAEQEQLRVEGRPAAPFELSTHTTCPSQGADIRINGFVTDAMKARWGRIVTEQGCRWGGGSAVDPTTGIPSDWNHVDLGPRK